MLADALVVIDIQNGVVKGDERVVNFDQLITRVNDRINDYHQAGKVLIYIQHCDESLLEGTYPWEIIEEIEKNVHGIYLNKTHANAYVETALAEILAAKKIKSLEICGAQTEYCIDGTIKFSHGLGYEVQVGKNMTTTVDNNHMTAQETITFYEGIWDKRFAKVY